MSSGESSRPPTLDGSEHGDLVDLGAIGPLELVVLERASIEAVLHGAVERDVLTGADARELLDELLAYAHHGNEIAATDIRRRFHRAADAERVVRTGEFGHPLPIAGYDDLTAAQIALRLPALTAAELREVHEHERRHGNRKSVLAAIESALR